MFVIKRENMFGVLLNDGTIVDLKKKDGTMVRLVETLPEILECKFGKLFHAGRFPETSYTKLDIPYYHSTFKGLLYDIRSYLEENGYDNVPAQTYRAKHTYSDDYVVGTLHRFGVECQIEDNKGVMHLVNGTTLEKVDLSEDAVALDAKSILELLYLRQLVDEALNRKKVKREDYTCEDRVLREYPDLEKDTYYVVEVAHRDTNPIHHAIYYHHSKDSYHNMLFNPSYDREATRVQPNQLYYFNVVREIDSSILNLYKLPKDVKCL